MGVGHVPSLDELKRRRDAIRQFVRDLDDATLEDLRRMAGQSNRVLEDGAGSLLRDGFPSGGGGVSTSGGEVSRPTESSALAALEHDPRADPIRTSATEVFVGLVEAHGALARVDRKRRYLAAARAAAGGKASSASSCQRCERVVANTERDRLRSGYCSACYQAWLRAGRPDRLAFERAPVCDDDSRLGDGMERT